ncbi:N-acetyl-gamma-glutamyl-phosphate reductase [Pelotomaculum terephthalicicum JT]|uniref:N-acetyl-gamma-glutamyl-phosphate reductase n=1 Tax=Pelotomaculum terephthalicicum TaxID=206393 RepID=UPI0009CFD6D1|nr:N-acetyl-gamma-glutamyl-phosphate reductase [Pelotomaculum terephthalicicum]MCG9968624.1 N-acetyl-gamma-glutamyl-phosphate reductase [Pelotomaculum terephthalicicum JT]OPY62599.1 MAG: N-acetyl-gamma-glutamyl-phosphate reductase [Pelotomaculum sp. PtaU1.Bin065]
MTVKVGIVGATGYTGAELVRILSRHPEVELVALGTQSYAGQPFWVVYPHLYKYNQLTCVDAAQTDMLYSADVVFVALPHGHAMPIAVEAACRGKKLIDLGADFRLADYKVYEKWYKVEHTARELLADAVYGLPEINRKKIREAKIVANPGCYPTSVILALAPLLRNKLVDSGSIIIDSKSGVSGAGRGLSLGIHFSEVNENFKAYNVAVHRHTPEIEQELGKLAGEDVTVSFTPHLLPITRGILSTIYAKLSNLPGEGEIIELYREFYKDEFFVRVLPEGMLPQTKWVAGTNHCDIGIAVDPRTGRIVIISAIDNIFKGAAGQAVQNMNIICGLPEDTALVGAGLFP